VLRFPCFVLASRARVRAPGLAVKSAYRLPSFTRHLQWCSDWSARGGVAEWLCSGLQSRVRRFDSDPRLQIRASQSPLSADGDSLYYRHSLSYLRTVYSLRYILVSNL
jgi:hypothetical protein